VITTTPNQFNALRMAGAKALVYSKNWFSDPVRTARGFTDFMMYTSGCHVATSSQEIIQSLFCNALLCGRWAMSGFPVVNMGHRTAAAFMATRVRPEDAASFVRVPWPAFMIRIPTPLLTIEDAGTSRDANLILVTSIAETDLGTPDARPGIFRWWYKLIADAPIKSDPRIDPLDVQYFSGLSLWGFNVETVYFASESVEVAVEAAAEAAGSDEHFKRWDTLDMTNSDERSDQLARSLIVASCLHLTGDPRERERREADEGVVIRSRSSKQRPDDTLPPYTEHEVTSSIKINLHHAMRDFVRVGGGAPSVQTLVAGHWKRQPYGARREHRRLIHVQPYWRGDVDAPISTRTK
jgi:hypothetical protein